MALHINPINNFLLMVIPWAQVFFFLSLSSLRRLLYYLLTSPRHSGRAEIRGHSMSAEKVKRGVGGFVFVAFIIERMCILTFSDITLIGVWHLTDKSQNSTLDFSKMCRWSDLRVCMHCFSSTVQCIICHLKCWRKKEYNITFDVSLG